MDVVAHTLWTNAVFHLKYHHQRRMRYLAAFFGVAPDLVGFTPVFVYMVLSGRIFSEQFPFTQTNWTFGFATEMYNYSHSLVIFAAVCLVLHVVGNIIRYRRDPGNYRFWFFWPILGWPLHILIDFPTHPNFYHTPIFFPLSDYQNTHGIAWSHPVFMVINYGLMAVVYLGLWWYQRRDPQQSNVQ